MGQYIPVSTPADKTYQRNRALTHIISFLGEKYKENHNGVFVQMQSDYKVGMDYIDRKCGKGYKSAIRNLMNSRRKMTVFNAGYRNWKFHRQKAEKFFRVLHQVLEKLNADDEIWALFDYLYGDISDSFPIGKRGSHIISYPYKAALNQVKNGNQYSREDIKAIARIESTFPAYDSLYND